MVLKQEAIMTDITQHQLPPPRRKRSGKKTTGIPYATATAGNKAREETIKWLRRLGCEGIGFFDHFEQHELELAFKHRGRSYRLLMSARGYAQMLLKKSPYSGRRRMSRTEYEQQLLEQGRTAMNSALREWAKGSVTAIETGMMKFEAVFMPHMLTADGRTVLERISEINLLPPPTG
jgi:hypothetical protein